MSENLRPRDGDALIVVDVQYDFLPGGALAVAGGDEILPDVHRLVDAFETLVFTQDWHPAGHASFASSHAGKTPFASTMLSYGEQRLWPDHCVQGSRGGALHDDLAVHRGQIILRKGMNPNIDFIPRSSRRTAGRARGSPLTCRLVGSAGFSCAVLQPTSALPSPRSTRVRPGSRPCSSRTPVGASTRRARSQPRLREWTRRASCAPLRRRSSAQA